MLFRSRLATPVAKKVVCGGGAVARPPFRISPLGGRYVRPCRYS